MKLKVKYQSESDIPEGFRELFEEKDGAFVLVGIDGIKTQADIDALKQVVDKEREQRRDAEKKLKRWETLGERDPDDVLKTLDEVEELRTKVETAGSKNEEAIQKRIDAAVAREVNPLNRQLTEVTKERDAAIQERDTHATTIRNTTLETSLTKAATAGKVRSEALEDVMRYKDLFEVSDSGEVVTRDGVGCTPGLTPDLWLDEVKEKRPHWWPDSQGGGSRNNPGNANGGVNNPFAQKSFDLTAASRLVRENPDRAKQLANAAGFSGPQEAIRAAARS